MTTARNQRRKTRENALTRIGAISLGMIACAAFGTARAADIITPTPAGGNVAFQSFSTEEPEKLAMLDVAEPQGVAGFFDPDRRTAIQLAAPSGAAKKVDGAVCRIPFSFPKTTDASSASLIELFCSDDEGVSWYPYASATAEQGRNVFVFEAPQSGEYWFVLKTHFRNGRSAYSSTRAYRFDVPEDDSFALREDAAEIPSAPADSGLLLEDDAPAALATADRQDDAMLISNASYVGEETEPAALPSAPSQVPDLPLDDPGVPQTGADVAAVPRPGKLKKLSFGKEDGSERLMITVRWFRPDEIDDQYRILVKSLSIERAPSPKGPWTIVGEDLDVNEKGYAWIATPEEMQPFYVRTVVVDSEGNVWKDATTTPMDVSPQEVRSALGAVKTPAPFPDAAKKTEKEEGESSFIRNTASQNSEEEDEPGAEKLSSPRDIARDDASKDKLVSGLEQKTATAPRRERPYVPAPTNPNEFQVNPLFTKGFSVLYHAAQTRPAPDNSGKKRSIFTPPDRAQRVASVRPAEHYRSAAQLAAIRAREERKKQEEQARYNKAHEMETFEQKPELMEGRMFYIDSNGNMTTTPPPEMQQALGVNADMLAQGWVPSGQTATATNQNADPNQLYMPRDTEAYDASTRSGAATFSNQQYPSASNPGSSPINDRYSGGATPAPQGATGQGYQTIPQTSSYVPQAVPSTGGSAFPPRPN